MKKCKPYPADVSDEEWNLAAPYLVLVNGNEPQHRDELCEMFNALSWMASAGAWWHKLPTNFPAWEMVSQQSQRQFNADRFEATFNANAKTAEAVRLATYAANRWNGANKRQQLSDVVAIRACQDRAYRSTGGIDEDVARNLAARDPRGSDELFARPNGTHR
ncbi:Putative transposase of IS4/5 family [Paraburkholderia lycopersici]|uniref:Putative transposase of IS4/5 family n=1 Tax=Paraburkholderia lycopersici TaxID=416944 RepID=A0A1G7BG72_9BURK|nr:Putative transposase of IS4/5 family [Paraburkholderia lycopersici]